LLQLLTEVADLDRFFSLLVAQLGSLPLLIVLLTVGSILRLLLGLVVAGIADLLGKDKWNLTPREFDWLFGGR
jgi:hypothetical protein